MAKKRKHQSDFREFLNKLKKEDAPRPLDRDMERRYFLIVTEGEKTEPNYFKGLVKELPNHLVEVEITGEGANTVSLIRAALAVWEERKLQRLKPDFDEVWAVFDKDDFSNEQFNEAIKMAKSKGMEVACSNEAFELWYVLHFQYLDAAISRKQYIDILKKKLKGYAKNDPDMYGILQEYGNEQDAINYAKKLYTLLSCGNPAMENPTTLVYRLVEKLNEFKPAP